MIRNLSLSKSKRFILLESAFFLHTGIIGAVYTLYLLSLGLSIFHANLISAVFNIASIAFEVPSGAMCDVIGKRKTAILAGISLGLAMLCFLLSINIYIVIVGQLLWGISYALESGTVEAWLVNDQSLGGSKLDNIFAASRKIQSFTMILGSFIGTWIADYSLKLIWTIPLLSAVIFILMVISFMEDKPNRSSNKSALNLHKPMLEYIKEGFKLILSSRVLSYIYILVALMGFVSSPLMIFWSIYLNKLDSTFSYMYLSTVWLLIQLSIIIGNQILECMGKYLGRKKILIVTFFIFGVSSIFMNIGKSMLTAILLICIQEIVWTMICSVQRGLLNDYIFDINRATMLSFSSLFNAIGKILASALFGYLADIFSVLFAWTLSGFLALFTACFVFFMYKKIDPISELK